jgi:hypothetical protein
MSSSGFNILDRKASAKEMRKKGAAMNDVATSKDRHSPPQKKKKFIPGGMKPKNNTVEGQRGAAQGGRSTAGGRDGVQRAETTRSRGSQRPEGGERGRAAHRVVPPPVVTKRPQLVTETVGTASPPPQSNRRKRKSNPDRWDQQKHQAPRSEAAQGLEAVANEPNDFDEDDASCGEPAQTVRQSNPQNFSSSSSPAGKPPRGGGGRWSSAANDRRLSSALGGQKPRRVSQQDHDHPSNQRVTRQQAGGDPGAMGGAPAPATRGTSRTRRSSSGDAAYQPRARREPVEDSPSTKRAKEKQAELKKQGNQSEEAITLSSSDEEPEEEGDADAGAGVISFLLDDEKIFFGVEAKPSAKRVQFTEDGLRMPAPEIWGDAEDADVVPYEEIESIKYGVGKHLFLSVSLLPESTKLKALLLKVPRMKKTRRKYQEIHRRRILLPLRQNQMELFSERRQQIIDRYVKTALVDDEEKFFAAARPHQITDLLAGTPYKVRHSGWRLLAPPQAHHLTGLGLVLMRASSVVHRCSGGHLPRLPRTTVGMLARRSDRSRS